MKDKPSVSAEPPLCPDKQEQSTQMHEQTDNNSNLSKIAIIHSVNFEKRPWTIGAQFSFAFIMYKYIITFDFLFLHLHNYMLKSAHILST